MSCRNVMTSLYKRSLHQDAITAKYTGSDLAVNLRRSAHDARTVAVCELKEHAINLADKTTA